VLFNVRRFDLIAVGAAGGGRWGGRIPMMAAE